MTRFVISLPENCSQTWDLLEKSCAIKIIGSGPKRAIVECTNDEANRIHHVFSGQLIIEREIKHGPF